MATYIYFILYEQITGVRPSQTGCATEFRCETMPFKRVITGKKQPGGPGRLSEARGRSSRAWKKSPNWKQMSPPAKQRKKEPATKGTGKSRGKGGQGKRK